MTKRIAMLVGAAVLLIRGSDGAPAAKTTENAPANTVPVHMVVTVEPIKDADKELYTLNREDVKVRKGKDRLQVIGWVPSRGEQAGLQLVMLMDDTTDSGLGTYIDEIRSFIQAQPPTTWVAVGYMRNTAVNIVQNFTNDHDLAAKAVRLSLGSTGASDSCYLSLVSLVKGWPENKMRREIVMITDGIDRLHGYNPSPSTYGSDISSGMRYTGRTRPAGLSGPGMPGGSMPYMSPNVDQASRAAQRSGVIVHSIFARGVGHVSRNYYEINNGQSGMAKLAEETGGEAFFLGNQNAVSFQPYFERLQNILNNQYFLVFQAKPGKKADLQQVDISTEIPKVEIVSADSVWVPGTAQ